MENLQKKINKLLDLYKHKKLLQAESLAKKLIKLNPKIAILYNILGLILTEQEKNEQAILIFEEGIKIKPDYAVFYNNLANIYKSQEKNIKAEIYYKKSIDLDNKIIEAINNLGGLYLHQNKTKKAISCFKKVLSINPNYFVSSYNLAVAHKSDGNFEEARNYFNQSIQSNKHLYSAHRALSQITNYQKNNDHLNLLIELFNDDSVEKIQKTELAFSLGKAFDDIKNYDQAYNHYEIGNDLRRKKIKFSLKEEKKEFSKIKKIFKKNNLDHSSNQDDSAIFILGMPRSGTTLVEQIISSHTQVFGGDELNFIPNLINDKFTDSSGTLSSQKVAGISKESLNLLGNQYINKIKVLSNNSQKITDKLPINFKWIGLIKLMLPNSKIIHCTRNPKDNCLSIFKNYFTSTELNYAYNLSEIVEFYNLYQDLMCHWKKKLPSFIFNISYERLINNPEKEIKKLIKFCNLQWEDNCLKFYNNKRTVKTASDTQIRKKIYNSSINSWKKYEKHLKPYFKKLKI